jgi:cytochrome c oxidase subunit 2
MEEKHSNHTASDNANSSTVKSNILPIVLVVSALLIGGAFLYSRQMTNKSAVESPAARVEDNGVNAGETSTLTDSDVKEYSIESSNFRYDVNLITVKKGENVKITLTNKEGMHDFVLDDFNVRTKVIENSGEESVTFVADKTGTFEYYCSVGKHREMGMVGKLVVEE